MMERELERTVKKQDALNEKLDEAAKNMHLSILGKDKYSSDRPLDVVDTYVKENTYVLVDPLNLRDLMMEIRDKNERMLAELETMIKVSNATTVISL